MGLPARITSGLPCSPGEGATPSPRADTPNQGQPEQGLQLYVSTLTTTTALLPHQSPAEIKRREVSWTLKKKLDAFAGPGEMKRRKVVLDPQVNRSSGLCKLDFFCFSCYSTAVETAFWRRSTASSVFRVGARGRAFTLSPPSLPVPVPNRPPSLCGHNAKRLLTY